MDGIDHTGLEIDEHRAGDVVLIIRLVEKDILSIIPLGSIVLQDTLWVDAMLMTEVLPELISNYIAHRLVN